MQMNVLTSTSTRESILTHSIRTSHILQARCSGITSPTQTFIQQSNNIADRPAAEKYAVRRHYGRKEVHTNALS